MVERSAGGAHREVLSFAGLLGLEVGWGVLYAFAY